MWAGNSKKNVYLIFFKIIFPTTLRSGNISAISINYAYNSYKIYNVAFIFILFVSIVTPYTNKNEKKIMYLHDFRLLKTLGINTYFVNKVVNICLQIKQYCLLFNTQNFDLQL